MSVERSSGEKILIISPRIKSVVVSQVQQKRLGRPGHCPGALQSRLLHLSYLMLTFSCPDLVIFCPVTGPADWGPLQVQWYGWPRPGVILTLVHLWPLYCTATGSCHTTFSWFGRLDYSCEGERHSLHYTRHHWLQSTVLRRYQVGKGNT